MRTLSSFYSPEIGDEGAIKRENDVESGSKHQQQHNIVVERLHVTEVHNDVITLLSFKPNSTEIIHQKSFYSNCAARKQNVFLLK